MRRFSAVVVAVVATAVLGLTGCVGLLLPLPAGDEPLQVPAQPWGATGVVGWADLPHCQNGPPDPWVLVDDFPVDVLEAAGIDPECGDTYLVPDLPPYVSITDSQVSIEELEALAAALEAADYARTEDSFDPVDGDVESGARGGWEYTFAGAGPDEVIRVYVINFWPGSGGPDTYFTYVDVETPETRALAE